jgi:hypothetical protein
MTHSAPSKRIQKKSPSDLYQEGFNSYQTKEWCPYEDDSDEARNWELGYKAAEESEKRLTMKKFKPSQQYKE